MADDQMRIQIYQMLLLDVSWWMMMQYFKSKIYNLSLKWRIQFKMWMWKMKSVWHLTCYIKNGGVSVFSVLPQGQYQNTQVLKMPGDHQILMTYLLL